MVLTYTCSDILLAVTDEVDSTAGPDDDGIAVVMFLDILFCSLVNISLLVHNTVIMNTIQIPE